MNKHKITIGLGIVIYALFIAPGFAATITGKINYEGDAPKLAEIKMDADPLCLAQHSGPAYTETLVLGEGDTLADVFVHVVSGLPKKEYPVPGDPVVVDQKGCHYSPHVLGVMAGQPIRILNPDGTLHNVHAFTKVNEEFNIAMPKFRKEVTKTFDKPEFMLSLKCDVHPWMGAWVAVMDHPYFSATKDDGVYTIGDLPAGEYEIEAWHEKLGTKKAVAVLTEGETKEINFVFSESSK